MTDTDAPKMRTKRRYAHELYPHAEEGETRPLAVEMPYLYALFVGLSIQGTDWFELGHKDRSHEERVLSYERTMTFIRAKRTALLADALLQGMTGDEAWAWADERAWDESSEIAYERAAHYGVPIEDIKPYPILKERDSHDHRTERGPNDRGWFIKRIEGKESECPECCEPIEATS